MSRRLEGCPVLLSQEASDFARLLTLVCDPEASAQSDGA